MKQYYLIIQKNIYNEIYQIYDLIKGIKAKISKGEYEYVIKRVLPKSDGGKEI